MAEPSQAEKFLANWAKDYVQAEPEDRLSMDGSVERLLEDAELAGVPKDEVVKAADGDVAAYVLEALEAHKRKASKAP
jgi:hypothetical protein